MFTALIADDETAPRAHLLACLSRVWPDLKKIEATDGGDAWDAFLEHEPDIAFLDVRMRGLTGIEVAQRIGGRAHIVFVSKPGDHAVAAFANGSADCVLKPVDDARLVPVIDRVRARLAQPGGRPADLQGLLDRLAGQVRKPAPLEVLQTGAGHDAALVRVDDVVYFESDARYTRAVYQAGDVLIRTPLKDLLSQLDAKRFWQVNRSLIVNQQHIAGTQRQDDGHMVLALRGRAEKLPVSRHFQGLFGAG